MASSLIASQHACMHACAQDPAIRSMAEQIATDPAFAHVTEILKTSFQDMMQTQAETGTPETQPMEPSVYMRAMAAKFDDPQFMAMAQQLGESVVEVRQGWGEHRLRNGWGRGEEKHALQQACDSAKTASHKCC